MVPRRPLRSPRSYSNTLLNGTKFEWSAQNGQVTLLTLVASY